MSVQAVLLPVFVQVALTFALLMWMATQRVTLIRRRQVHPRDIALGQPAWPPHVQQVSNAFRNQCELPVLFHVLVILALFTRSAGLLFVVLAWLFVLARLAHAYVHVTSNRVSVRGPLYGIGALVLIIMWIVFAIDIYLAAK